MSMARRAVRRERLTSWHPIAWLSAVTPLLPPQRAPSPLPNGRGAHANSAQAAGTRAWNWRGRLSNPFTIVLVWTNRRLPIGTAPNSATYSDVMSAEPAVGTGQVPIIRKFRQARIAEFCGGLPPGAPEAGGSFFLNFRPTPP